MSESQTDERLEAGDLARMPAAELAAAVEGGWCDHLQGQPLPAQLPREALSAMSSEGINRARKLGLLDDLMGVSSTLRDRWPGPSS